MCVLHRTYKTWIPVREERCWKQPGRSWIFWASLGESATASHSCCTPFGGFWTLSGKTVPLRTTLCAHSNMQRCVFTNPGNSVPTVPQSQRELSAACWGCLAWSAGDQWEKELDGLESQLSVWSSTPTAGEQSRELFNEKDTTKGVKECGGKHELQITHGSNG